MYSKSPRVMEFDEIARDAKIHKKPEPSSYTPDYKLIEGRLKGCFNQKGDRTNHIDEAEYRGRDSPSYKDKVYS